MGKQQRPRVHFDLGRSINQMLGLPDHDHGDHGLPGRHARAMRTPVGQLEHDQLQTLFTQSPSPAERALLVQTAVELLARDVFDSFARPLVALIAAQRDILDEQPETRRRIAQILTEHADEIAAYDGFDFDEIFAAVADLLRQDAPTLQIMEHAFARAHRSREVHAIQLARRALVKDRAELLQLLIAYARETSERDAEECAWAWMTVAETDPSHEVAYAEAEQLFATLESWECVALVLERRADDRIERGDTDGALEDLRRVADLAITRLDDAERLERATARIATITSR